MCILTESRDTVEYINRLGPGQTGHSDKIEGILLNILIDKALVRLCILTESRDTEEYISRQGPGQNVHSDRMKGYCRIYK